jgi:hypothetical protein
MCRPQYACRYHWRVGRHGRRVERRHVVDVLRVGVRLRAQQELRARQRSALGAHVKRRLQVPLWQKERRERKEGRESKEGRREGGKEGRKVIRQNNRWALRIQGFLSHVRAVENGAGLFRASVAGPDQPSNWRFAAWSVSRGAGGCSSSCARSSGSPSSCVCCVCAELVDRHVSNKLCLRAGGGRTAGVPVPGRQTKLGTGFHKKSVEEGRRPQIGTQRTKGGSLASPCKIGGFSPLGLRCRRSARSPRSGACHSRPLRPRRRCRAASSSPRRRRVATRPRRQPERWTLLLPHLLLLLAEMSQWPLKASRQV